MSRVRISVHRRRSTFTYYSGLFTHWLQKQIASAVDRSATALLLSKLEIEGESRFSRTAAHTFVLADGDQRLVCVTHSELFATQLARPASIPKSVRPSVRLLDSDRPSVRPSV